MIERERIIEALKEVRHPAMQDRDIVDLGLVADIECGEDKVVVTLGFPKRRDPLTEYLVGATRASLVRHLPSSVSTEVKAVVKENNSEKPKKKGLDLRANLDSPVELKPLERKLIPTGLYMALPKGYEAQVRPRSGLAIKKGITVLNSPGTIDADYRGEICVILINLSDQPFLINDGERIAQMVIARHEQAGRIKVILIGEELGF